MQERIKLEDRKLWYRENLIITGWEMGIAITRIEALHLRHAAGIIKDYVVIGM